MKKKRNRSFTGFIPFIGVTPALVYRLCLHADEMIRYRVELTEAAVLIGSAGLLLLILRYLTVEIYAYDAMDIPYLLGRVLLRPGRRPSVHIPLRKVRLAETVRICLRPSALFTRTHRRGHLYIRCGLRQIRCNLAESMQFIYNEKMANRPITEEQPFV